MCLLRMFNLREKSITYFYTYAQSDPCSKIETRFCLVIVAESFNQGSFFFCSKVFSMLIFGGK